VSPRRSPTIAARLALGAALAVGVSCAAGAGNPEDGTSTSSGGEVLGGEAAFQKRCSSCHGDDAEGTGSGPQVLNPVVGYADYVVRHGRDEMGFPSGMASYSEEAIDDAELESILDWLRDAPRPKDGAALYVRFCGNCHGTDAKGGRVGEGIAGEEADEIDEQVREGHGGDDYGNRKKYMPSWSTSELSHDEVAAIADYLAGLGGGEHEGDDDDDGD